MKKQKEKTQSTKMTEKPIVSRPILKSVTPTIVSYETLKEEFTTGLKFKPALGLQNSSELNPKLKGHLTKLLKVLDKHKDALEEIEQMTLNFLVSAIRENPPVYIARTRDIKTDIEYFIAKTSIPYFGGTKKEVKVYLGKASDYDNDTKNNMAKVVGKRLLIKALNEKFDL